ncbi:MAG TPA: DUF916 domain-containing protein, partial [Galbitalea sp.]
TSAAGDNSRSAFAYAVKPGVEIQDYVGVSNQGTKSTTFNTYAADAINDFKTGAFSLDAAGTKPTDLGSWIHLPEKTITIAPGKEARIPVTILVPSDATPGDHTAGIIASIIRKSTTANGKKIRVEERVAARVYLHVAGAVSAHVLASGLTSGFSPSLNPFAGGSSTVNYSVRNSGNLRVDVAQKITISGPFGIVLGHINGPSIRNILPGQAVQEQLRLTGIAPLLLVWSSVALTTAAPTDTIVTGTVLTDTGAVAAPIARPKYPTFSSSSLTGAVPWTLLLLLIVVGLGIWILARYLAASRDRVFLAIDAAAEEARAQALEQQKDSSKSEARTEEPVA